MHVKYYAVDIGKKETRPSIQKTNQLAIMSEYKARCRIVMLFEPLQQSGCLYDSRDVRWHIEQAENPNRALGIVDAVKATPREEGR
ncbi:hypothetical protein SE17_05760 [Kouleothrix aurantiaca]|uniref:Uncharacterized protein n=1 Tax=Kouleothrix aurantiaca TaxID=186479 RepID=A0A0P9HH12_9CHLR|nr:hypothetical protein SE17_05760 [Kouleothrix aurantiaca]